MSDVMGRPRETAEAASVRVTFRAGPDLVEEIDRKRGSRSRGRYLRDLIRADTQPQRVAQHDTASTPPVPAASQGAPSAVHRHTFGQPVRRFGAWRRFCTEPGCTKSEIVP